MSFLPSSTVEHEFSSGNDTPAYRRNRYVDTFKAGNSQRSLEEQEYFWLVGYFQFQFFW